MYNLCLVDGLPDYKVLLLDLTEKTILCSSPRFSAARDRII